MFSGTLIFDILKVSYYDMRLIHPRYLYFISGYHKHAHILPEPLF